MKWKLQSKIGPSLKYSIAYYLVLLFFFLLLLHLRIPLSWTTQRDGTGKRQDRRLLISRTSSAARTLSSPTNSPPTSLLGPPHDKMEEVDDLVLTPFKEIAEKARLAVVNAGDGNPIMLQAAQSLLKEGDRGLRKISPLCKKQYEDYGTSFIASLKDNGMYSFFLKP